MRLDPSATSHDLPAHEWDGTKDNKSAKSFILVLCLDSLPKVIDVNQTHKGTEIGPLGDT